MNTAEQQEPESIGQQIENLPALDIQVEGNVLATNLDEYRERALEFIGSISTDLQDDQDFADAETTAKMCKAVEDRLTAAKDQAISQTSSIEKLFSTIDELAAAVRDKRLVLERAAKTRKAERRAEIQRDAERAFADFLADVARSLAPIKFDASDLKPDFAAAMKNKRTVKSWQDAAGSALTAAKTAASERAKHIESNVRQFEQTVPEHRRGLFPDLDRLALKQWEDLETVIRLRIQEADVADAKREADQARPTETPPETPPVETAATVPDDDDIPQAPPAGAVPRNPEPPPPPPAQNRRVSRPTNNVQTRNVTVVATFSVVVDARRPDTAIVAGLRSRLENAGFNSLTAVAVQPETEQ